ncbi:MAG: ABC transporter ATP-binding protein [Clostridia bacterium]|nr:ABC transporter ATP-binding protein [Clostridia bacterium]
MKKKKDKKRLPEKQKRGSFSKEELEALQKAGLDTSSLLMCCRCDMSPDGEYKDSWICFDEKGLYCAWGTEEIDAKKTKHGKHEIHVTIDTISALPIEDADRLICEKYVSTGALVTEKDGELQYLSRFSIGKLGEADTFANAFNDYKNKGSFDLPPEDDQNEDKCKICGEPCPPGKEYCRKHEKNSATAIRLFKFFGGYIPQVALIIFMMLLGSAVRVYVPQIGTRALFDTLLANPDGNPVAEQIKALGTLVLSIFGIRLIHTVMSAVQQYFTGSIMPRVTYDIKMRIFKAMQRLSLNFYSSKQTGSLMERVVRDSNNIYWFFVDGVPEIIIDAATIIGVIAIMFSMSWRLTLIVLAAIPLVFLTLYFGDKVFRGMHHRSWLFSAKLSSMVSDNINGQKIIKAFSKEDDEYQRFSDVNENYRKAELRLSLFEATAFPLIEALIVILSAIVLGVGGVMVAKGTLTTGTLLSFIVYFEMLIEPFDFLSWVSDWWARCADSAQRVFEICDAQAQITEKENAVGFDELRGEIDIRELSFEYEPARPVIKKLSLHVNAGEMLGIVGKTGAGKTTIANLIARLYDAKQGCILIDDIDVRDLKLSELRKNIGLVSQDIYLFIGTIADNIRYAKPDADMSEVIAAAKAASAHDFIMKLPDGYETRVGAGGRSLSGGERQRISIARTIIQNPKILILDEATAAMDTETERNIQGSLSKLKKGRTTLAIAHRLSTLRDADRLAVIEDGTIVENGTFEELIRKKGAFYKLYKIQAEALKNAGILSSTDEAEPQDETED